MNDGQKHTLDGHILVNDGQKHTLDGHILRVGAKKLVSNAYIISCEVWIHLIELHILA